MALHEYEASLPSIPSEIAPSKREFFQLSFPLSFPRSPERSLQVIPIVSDFLYEEHAT